MVEKTFLNMKGTVYTILKKRFVIQKKYLTYQESCHHQWWRWCRQEQRSPHLSPSLPSELGHCWNIKFKHLRNTKPSDDLWPLQQMPGNEHQNLNLILHLQTPTCCCLHFHPQNVSEGICPWPFSKSCSLSPQPKLLHRSLLVPQDGADPCHRSRHVCTSGDCPQSFHTAKHTIRRHLTGIYGIISRYMTVVKNVFPWPK